MRPLAFSADEPTWLPAVAARLRDHVSKGEPPLAGTPLAADRYRAVVTALFDPHALVIENAQFHEDATSAHVQGTAKLFGSATVPVTLGYRGVDGACYFELEASPSTWKALESLEKLGLPWDGLRARWSYGPLALPGVPEPVPPTSYVDFDANVKLGGFSLPVQLVPPQKPDVSGLWRIAGNFETVPLTQLGPILRWIAQRAALPDIPGLERLSALELTGLELAFDPETPRLSAGFLAVASAARWPLLGKQVVLDNAAVSLGFSAEENGGYAVQGEVSATLILGEESISVGVYRDSGTGAAVLELRSEDATLPNLSELANLVGLPALANALPAPVRELTGFLIEDLRFELDSKTRKLSNARIELACPDDVGIVSHTTLENFRLALEISPQAATKVSGSITALVNVAGDYLGLQGELGETLELSGNVDELPLSALASRMSRLPKLPEINLSNVVVSLSTDGELHFDASVDVHLAALAEALKVSVPNGMALQLSSLCLTLDAKDGTWNVELATDEHFHFPYRGEHRLDLSGFHLSFGVGSSKELAVSGAFDLAGSVALGDVTLALTGNGLHASLDATGNWSMKGTATVEAFGKNYPNWSASIHQKIFRLSHDGPISVVDESFASATILDFSIAVVETSETRLGEDGARWGFEVSGDGSLKLPGVVEAQARLALDTTTGNLVLSAKKPPVPSIPLAPGVTLGLELDELRFTKDGKAWSFGSAATVQMNGVPQPLQPYFPAVRRGSLQVGADGVTVSCTLDGWDIDFGPISIKIADKVVPLGEPKMTPLWFGVRFGKTPSVGLDLRVDIPRELNRLLGWDAELNPTTIFLNPSMDLGLRAAKQGFTMALEHGTSPLKALKIDEEGYCSWDLGEVGTFRFEVPTLTFEGGAWKASFGMSHGPLKVPLLPVKFLMRHLGVPGTSYVPDALPIPRNIDVTRLGRALPKLLGPAVWKAIQAEPALATLLKRMFEAIGKVAGDVEKKFPVDFVDYLTLHIPDTIHLDIDTRGPTFALWTDDAEPLKFLVPWFAAMPPGLAGFTLKKVAFGQLAGTVGLLTVDGHADYFDVVTLTVSAFPGVKARELRNRLTAVEMLAVVPSAFPFPIPLFYDDLRWEVNSWTGLGLTTDWKMKADCSLFDTSVALFDFFTKKGYLLSRDAKEAFDIQFRIGPNFIALPAYVGGGEVGQSESVTPTLPAGDSLKRLLDTLKTGNLTYLITAIPLHDAGAKTWYRLGRKKDSVKFGPLAFSAGVGWCIATQEELNEEILRNPKAKAILGDLNSEDVLKSLPTKASEPSYRKGFVVMLMGEAGVAPIIEAKGYFGMALTAAREYDARNEGGFECGFVMQGTIAELLALRIQGDIHVARDETTTVHGDCSLTFAGIELIGGGATTTVGPDSFELGVTLRLAGEACKLTGCFHIDPAQTVISGFFEWSYGAKGESFSREGVQAVFSPYGVALRVVVDRFFGIAARFTFFVDARAKGVIGARASLDVSAVSKHVLGRYSEVADDIGRKANDLQDEYQRLLGQYQGHMSSAELLASFLSRLAEDLPGIVDAEVKKAAPSGFKDIARKQAKKQSKAIARRLDELANDLNQADAEHAKGLIIGLINTVLAARVTIQIKFVKPFYDKSIWDFSAAKPYEKKLENARSFVEKIPAEKIVAKNAKGVWQQAVAKQNIARDIADAVKKGTGFIPQIREIRWETTQLAKLSPASRVNVVATYQGEPMTLVSAPFDLDDPVASALGVAKAIVDAIAKPPKTAATRRTARRRADEPAPPSV